VVELSFLGFHSPAQLRKDFHFWRPRQDPSPFLKHSGLDPGRGGEVKVFWFFSSEKNIFRKDLGEHVICFLQKLILGVFREKNAKLDCDVPSLAAAHFKIVEILAG
jgi:hypothetical protein